MIVVGIILSVLIMFFVCACKVSSMCSKIEEQNMGKGEMK